MEQLTAQTTKSLVLFLQNSYGIFIRPYITYRSLVKSSHAGQVFPLFLIIGVYFFFAGVIRHGLHPFIVAKSGIKISAAAFMTYAIVVFAIYSIGLLLKGKGNLKSISLAWAYSLWPTLIWFYVTSATYLLIPPPRTSSFQGQLFSYLFIALSLALFFWKGVLYYLTLRFGVQLDLRRIIIASTIIFPVGIGYSLLMYSLGIFRIPFI